MSYYARPMQLGRSVLIVEDEPLIAMMLEEFIDVLGHRVSGGAETVADALARIDEGGFDLVILDVNLRDGAACWPIADALAERNVPFLLASGGHLEPPPPRHDNAPKLAKPYGLSDVRAAIASIEAMMQD